jgi:hypothetical protein
VSLLFAMSHQTRVRLAEVAFLVILIAGVWPVAAELLDLRWQKVRIVVAGGALAIAAFSSSSPHRGSFG